MLRPEGDEVRHAVEHGKALSIRQGKDSRGVIHRLDSDQAAAIAGLPVDQVLEGEDHVVHGHRLAVVPGDALVRGEGGRDRVHILTERPVRHKVGLDLPILVCDHKGSRDHSIVVQLSENPVFCHDIGAVNGSSGANAQLLHNAGGRLCLGWGGFVRTRLGFRRGLAAAGCGQKQYACKQQRRKSFHVGSSPCFQFFMRKTRDAKKAPLSFLSSNRDAF